MQSQTILIVDDSEDARLIFSSHLRHHGFRVLEAANGAEGVQAARTHCPDLVVMDLAMPVMDGFAATRQLKSEAATAAIPVLACSAHVNLADVRLAFDELFAAYLTKPVTASTLIEAARSLLDPTSES